MPQGTPLFMHGEFLTRVTIWLALAGYAIGLIIFLLAKGRRTWETTARYAWTIGCVSLWVHVALAYHFFHSWSFSSSYKETAELTAQVVGVYWGGGIFFNYLFMIVWLVDAFWWWRGLDVYRSRRMLISIFVHVFLFFIVFNATVVFESGVLRWFGFVFSIVVFLALLSKRLPATTR